MLKNRISTLLVVLLLGAGFALFIYLEYRSYLREVGSELPPLEVKRNVYLITATGLRPDHLSSFMYQSIQTPALDFLAYDGVRFTNSWTVSPESLPAHFSLLTGVYPFRNPVSSLVQRYYTRTLASNVATGFTMPEWLRRKGYLTAAFVSDPDLRIPGLMSGLFQTVAMGDKTLHSWEAAYTPNRACRLAADWIEKKQLAPSPGFVEPG